MPCRWFYWALAGAALAGGHGAQADILLSGQLSGLGYSLIDLDPGDDQAPGISFANAFYSLDGGLREGPVLPRADQTASSFFATLGPLPLKEAVSRSVQRPHAGVESGVSGQLADHSYASFVTAQALGDKADPTFASLVRFGSGAPLSLLMTLAPGTQVVWTGHLDLSATATQGRRAGRTESGHIGTTFYLREDDYSQTYDGYSDFLYLDPGVAASKSLSNDFSLTLSNTGLDFRTARLEGYLVGEAIAFYPVPEAAASWTLLCGLGVLAATVRARRRSHRCSGAGSPCDGSPASLAQAGFPLTGVRPCNASF